MVSSTKLITLCKFIFSCRPLFTLFFEFCCGGWFIFVWSIFVVSVVIFCVVFNLCISSSSSFIFCCCLSLLVLLVLEMVGGRFFPCFQCLLVGLIDQGLSCMFGLVLLSKLVIRMDGFWLFLNILAYVGFSGFSVSSIALAFICTFGLHFKLLNFYKFLLMYDFYRWYFIWFVFCISSYSFFPNYCLSILLIWSILVFVTLIFLLQKKTIIYMNIIYKYTI